MLSQAEMILGADFLNIYLMSSMYLCHVLNDINAVLCPLCPEGGLDQEGPVVKLEQAMLELWRENFIFNSNFI